MTEEEPPVTDSDGKIDKLAVAIESLTSKVAAMEKKLAAIDDKEGK
jgi:outer membrane murein-binding lipoprotein Lpp